MWHEILKEKNSNSMLLLSKEGGQEGVEVSFAPATTINENGKLEKYTILPRFNDDRIFYSPAFINPY